MSHYSLRAMITTTRTYRWDKKLMEKVAQKPWSWTLYKTDEGLVLSVLSGGVAMVEINVTLTKDEAAEWSKSGENGLKPLIDAIQQRPAEFKSRHVSLPH